MMWDHLATSRRAALCLHQPDTSNPFKHEKRTNVGFVVRSNNTLFGKKKGQALWGDVQLCTNISPKFRHSTSHLCWVGLSVG